MDQSMYLKRRREILTGRMAFNSNALAHREIKLKQNTETFSA